MKFNFSLSSIVLLISIYCFLHFLFKKNKPKNFLNAGIIFMIAYILMFFLDFKVLLFK